MAGATMLGSPAWIEALIAATVYREQMRDLADEQWRASRAAAKRGGGSVAARALAGDPSEATGPSSLAVAS